MAKSVFGFARPEESPGFLLWKTTLLWQRSIKNALDPYDISHAQFVIMAVLLWFEEAKQAPIQSAIINQTELDKMTVSKSLKSLVLKGLVERFEHTQDMRAKTACLTKNGRSLTKKLVSIVEDIDYEFFNAIKKRDQKFLLNLLRSLIG